MNNELNISLNDNFINIYEEYSLINYQNLNENESFIILNYRNDDQVRNRMVDDRIIMIEDHLKFVNSLKDKKQGYWVLKKGDLILGSISLVNYKENSNSFEAGNFLNPSLIGSGKGLLINYITRMLAFEKIKANKLEAKVKKDNIGALRLNDLFGNRDELIKNNDYIYFQNEKKNWSNIKDKLNKMLKYV